MLRIASVAIVFTSLAAAGCSKPNSPSGANTSGVSGSKAPAEKTPESAATSLRGQVREKDGRLFLSLDESGRVEMEFVKLKAGTFKMGSAAGEKDREADEGQHGVTLTKDFWMGVTEVSQEQWEAVTGNNPSAFKSSKMPIHSVSWEDCHSFLSKANETLKGRAMALPTEAEWEYACRAGSESRWSFGDDEGKLGEYARCQGIGGDAIIQVGAKNANAWGLKDMHGNEFEWCEDWYGDYAKGEAKDPTGAPSGDSRVMRGGSWYVAAKYSRSAARSKLRPNRREGHVGFRVVLR